MRARRSVLSLVVAVSLGLAATSAFADDPEAGSIKILDGSPVVQPLAFMGWSVKADMNLMAAPTISGHITATGGTGNDIQVLVLTESDYANWQNKHTVTPIYDSGQVTAADVKAQLSESGTYYVVLSNLFSTFTPKTVEGTLRMTWQPSAAVLAQRQATLDVAKTAEEARQKVASSALFRDILLLVLASAVVGGGTVLLVMQRKKKAAPAKVKTEA